MNQQLQKLADTAGKTYGAWQKQMRRDGFTKREQLSADGADLASMKDAARALWFDYQIAQNELNKEAANASQPDLDFESAITGGGDKTPPGGKKTSGLKIVTNPGYPDPATVVVPEGLEKQIVSPAMLADLRALNSSESIRKAKPSAKVQTLNDRTWVVTSVGEGYAVLTACQTEDHFDGNVVADLSEREGDDWAGLLFASGPGNSKKYVLCNAAQSVAVVAGDPLANVGLENSGS